MDDGGLSKFQRRMNLIPKNVREAVTPALQRSADEMAASIKALVPVDTGALRESVEVTPGGQSTPPYSQPGGAMTVPENAIAITVGNTDVRYGHLVEYGTSETVAQPFFWPSVRLNRKRATNRIKRAIRAAVKKEWGK